MKTQTKNKTEEELKRKIEELWHIGYEEPIIEKNSLQELMVLKAQLLGFQQGQAEERKEFLEMIDEIEDENIDCETMLIKLKIKLKEK